MPNKNIYYSLLFFLLQIFSSITIKSNISNIKEISLDIYNFKESKLARHLYLYFNNKVIFDNESIDRLIERIKHCLKESEDNSLVFIKKISLEMDKKFISHINLAPVEVRPYQDETIIAHKIPEYNKNRIEDFLEKSYYFKVIKEKNLIDSTCYGKIQRAIENDSLDSKLYYDLMFFAIEETQDIKEINKLIKNRFLAKARTRILLKMSKNNDNKIYKKPLVLSVTDSPNIEDNEIKYFLKIKDKNKLLPLTQKDGTDISRIIYAGKENKDVLIQFSFYEKDGFIEKEFQKNDLDFNCTFYNINQENSKYYSVVAITTDKNGHPLKIGCIFVNKKEINCIENFIIYGSKSYWDSQPIEEINFKQKNNSYLENKILEDEPFFGKKKLLKNKLIEKESITYTPYKSEDGNLIFPSFFLLTDDPEFSLKIPLLEKNKEKYPYHSIILEPKKIKSFSSITLKNNTIIELLHQSNNFLKIKLEKKETPFNEKIETTGCFCTIF